MLARLLSTTAPWPTLLIRPMVRAVKTGLPMPEVLGPMVGGIEIVAGVAVILGAGTRVAAVLLATIT